MMNLADVIFELQSMYDKYGNCYVGVAHDNNDVLDTWTVNRICFFKDGEDQTVIIVEDD